MSVRGSKTRRALAIGLAVPLVALLGTILWLRFPASSPLRYQLGAYSWLAGLSDTTSRIKNGDLLLYLRPGGCTVSGCLVSPATDISQSDVQVRLPLYPGAQPSTHPMLAGLVYPMTPYLKAASTEFVLPIDPATAEAWFAQQFERLNYSAGSYNGSSGDNNTGETVTNESYTRTSNPQLQVEIDFEPFGGQTLLFYGAATTALPARPPSSFLPLDVSHMDVTLTYGSTSWPYVAALRVWHHTVTDRATLRRFVRLINSLPHSSEGIGGSLADADQALLIFRETDGQSRSLSLRVCCGDIVLSDSPDLDGKAQLWPAIVSLARASGVHIQWQ